MPPCLMEWTNTRSCTQAGADFAVEYLAACTTHLAFPCQVPLRNWYAPEAVLMGFLAR